MNSPNSDLIGVLGWTPCTPLPHDKNRCQVHEPGTWITDGTCQTVSRRLEDINIGIELAKIGIAKSFENGPHGVYEDVRAADVARYWKIDPDKLGNPKIASNESRDQGCEECTCGSDDFWFSRDLCPACNDTMHYYCNICGGVAKGSKDGSA